MFHFVTGPVTADKRQALLNHFLESKKTNPAARLIYLIPEHIKFDTEEAILNHLQEYYSEDQAASFDIQVLSFSRLLWFLDKKNQFNNINISRLGLSMILRQIIIETKDELEVFGRQVNKQGFTEDLMDLFTELFEGNIQVEDLSLALEDFESPIGRLHQEQEIKDLQNLYARFLDRVVDLSIEDYAQYDQIIDLLVENGTNAFQDTYMVVDQYYGLNARQMGLISQLAAHLHTLYYCIPLTKEDLSSKSTYNPVLNLPKRTYHQVLELLQTQAIPVGKEIDITAKHSYEARLAENFKRMQAFQPIQNNNSLEIVSFFTSYPSIHDELLAVTNEINRLVREEGLRYKDILVTSRQLEDYKLLAPIYFQLNEIPLFFDHASKMADHPFMMLLESLINLKRYNYRISDIMQILKSPLVSLADPIESKYLGDRRLNTLAQVENILIENGFEGYLWKQKALLWHFDKEDFPVLGLHGEAIQGSNLGQLINQMSQWLSTEIIQPLENWQSGKGRETATWLYHLLTKLGVEKGLSQARDRYIDQGDLERARQCEQIWDTFIEFLDEFVTIFEKDNIDFNLFNELLIKSIKDASFHIIPPSMDQVTFTAIDSPQVKTYQVSFVLGLNHDAFPRLGKQNSFLTRSQRMNINQAILPHQYLSDFEQDNFDQELFVFYQSLLKSEHRYYFSFYYDANKDSNDWSNYVKNLMVSLEGDYKALDNHIAYASPLLQLMETLGQIKLDNTDECSDQNLREKLRELYSEFDNLDSLLNQLSRFNDLPSSIAPETAKKLYGTNLSASVSRIETFYQDPFSHFLIYGLKLKERESYKIDALKTGDYYHAVLDILVKSMIDQGIDWQSLDLKQIQALLMESVQVYEDNLINNIFKVNGQNRAIQHQLNQDLFRFLQISQEQARILSSRPLLTEQIFGQSRQAQLQTLDFPLQRGGRLSLTGKIDRIDQITTQKGRFIEVIDYKSSPKDFKLTNVYYGLDLQILTYLGVALSNYPEYRALGAFYQSLKQDFQKEEENFEQDHFKVGDQLNDNRLSGFVSVDEGAYQLIEPSLEDYSSVFNLKINKNGSYSKTSQVVSEGDLQLLLDYVHGLFTQAGDAILAGEITLQPYKDLQYTPSLQYPYRVISGFDASSNYQAYRKQTINKNQVMTLIQESLEERKK